MLSSNKSGQLARVWRSNGNARALASASAQLNHKRITDCNNVQFWFCIFCCGKLIRFVPAQSWSYRIYDCHICTQFQCCRFKLTWIGMSHTIYLLTHTTANGWLGCQCPFFLFHSIQMSINLINSIPIILLIINSDLFIHNLRI